VSTNVHNVRIERLWRETNRVVIAFYKDIFNFLEASCLLDSNSELNLFAVQFIYLPRINASLEQGFKHIAETILKNTTLFRPGKPHFHIDNKHAR